MGCSSKEAASVLAHKRWGTAVGSNKQGKSKKKRKRGDATPSDEKEAPGVKERRKAGKASTHFSDVVSNLEKKHAAKGRKKAKKKTATPQKPTQKINNIQSLVRRK
jgi:hypothetical protein